LQAAPAPAALLAPPPPLPSPSPGTPRPPLQLDLPPPEPETITAVPLPPSDVAPTEVAPVASGWFVQLGVFADRTRADSLLPLPTGLGFGAVEPIGDLWRVRAGPFDEVQARATLAQLRARGYQDAVLVRPD